MPVLNPKALIEERVEAYRGFNRRHNLQRFTVGVSGGADSFLVVFLGSLAVGPENVNALWQGINSNPDALERARQICRSLGVRLVECDWTEDVLTIQRKMIAAMVKAGYSQDDIDARISTEPNVLGGHRSCFRAPNLRLFNRLGNPGYSVVHGTGNECEDRWVRFFQKGGDGDVDTGAISMFSKGEVYQLIHALPVAEAAKARILTAVPSPDLWGVGNQHNDDTEMKRFLRMTDCTMPVYSFIDPATGLYRNVGLIERVSRFLDKEIQVPGNPLRPRGYDGPDVLHVEDVLFGMMEPDLDALMALADATGYFRGMDPATVGLLLGNARRVEAMTRHKYNPMIDPLGTREEMVEKGLLTNELPDV